MQYLLEPFFFIVFSIIEAVEALVQVETEESLDFLLASLGGTLGFRDHMSLTLADKMPVSLAALSNITSFSISF